MPRIEILPAKHAQNRSPSVMDPLEVLRPGDRLKAQVLRIMDRGDILLEFANRQVRARIDFEVRQGQVLDLEVEKAARPLVMRVVTQSGLPDGGAAGTAVAGREKGDFESLNAMVETVTGLLASRGEKALGREVFSALKQMIEVLAPLRIEASAERLAVSLRQRLEDGGHFFEHRLGRILTAAHGPERDYDKPEPATRALIKDLLGRDLKPALETGSRWLASPAAEKMIPRHKLAGLRKMVALTAKQVEERQQRLVAEDRKQPQGIMLYFQFPVAGRRKPLKLGVYYPRGARSGPSKAARVTLLLEMDNLGPVRADLCLGQGLLNVDVCLSRPAAADFVRRHLVSLETGLGEHFDKVQCRVVSDSAKVEQFKRRFELSSDRRIDINV